MGDSATDLLELFEADPATSMVIYLGEIGSSEEDEVAALAARGSYKPVVALLVGSVGDPNQAMGHAGAVVYGPTVVRREATTARAIRDPGGAPFG